MFDSLINYWSYSNDSSLIPTIQQGMLHQVGPDNMYLPPNQTKSIGNDDQAVWGNAAMTAAEVGFPMPSNSNITWHQLATNVFDSIAARWDTGTCGGGLRWQIFSFNVGYNYKNSASLASFAQLAARLHRFTGNETYSDWAQKAVEWGENVGLIDSESGQVFDGTDTNLNCTDFNHIQWTCNYGWFLGAAAHELNVVSFPSLVLFVTLFTDLGPISRRHASGTASPSLCSRTQRKRSRGTLATFSEKLLANLAIIATWISWLSNPFSLAA